MWKHGIGLRFYLAHLQLQIKDEVTLIGAKVYNHRRQNLHPHAPNRTQRHRIALTRDVS